MHIAARSADGADQQRNLQTSRADQHQAQVALDRVARKCRLAAAEVAGSGIGRAAVAADEMRLFGETEFEGCFGKTRAANAGGREYADFCVV